MQRQESNNLPPDHVGILIAAAILFVIGWGGLYVLVNTEIPRIAGQLWVFFVLFHLGITAITIPIVRYINVRLTPINQPIIPGGIVVRQSVWVGLYMVICAWLQMPRVLTLPVALLLALVFIVIEVFLRNREIASER